MPNRMSASFMGAPSLYCRGMRRAETRTEILVVLALTALTYLPALGNDFVNWDDDQYVYNNARLADTSLSALTAHFLEHDYAKGWPLPNVMGNYHPLTMLSLQLDRQLS